MKDVTFELRLGILNILQAYFMKITVQFVTLLQLKILQMNPI